MGKSVEKVDWKDGLPAWRLNTSMRTTFNLILNVPSPCFPFSCSLFFQKYFLIPYWCETLQKNHHLLRHNLMCLLVVDVVCVVISKIGRTMAKTKQMTRKHAAKNRRNADADAQHGIDVQKALDTKEKCHSWIDIFDRVNLPFLFFNSYSASTKTRFIIMWHTIIVRMCGHVVWVIRE